MQYFYHLFESKGKLLKIFNYLILWIKMCILNIEIFSLASSLNLREEYFKLKLKK